LEATFRPPYAPQTTTRYTVPFEPVGTFMQRALNFLAATTKIAVCLDLTPCSLVERYKRFEETFYQNARRHIPDSSDHVHLHYVKNVSSRLDSSSLLMVTGHVLQPSNQQSPITGVKGSMEQPIATHGWR
jgi:hypothetical protein